MKTSAGLDLSVQQRSRWSRITFALAALALGMSAALAQTYNISTLAGQLNSPGTADGTGAAARFSNPQSVAVDAAGNAYVADTNSHTIRKMVISTGVVTTVAGSAGTLGTANGTGGAGGTARFNFPQGIAVNTAGTTLYVADTFNHTIRVIDLSASPVNVTTLAGAAGTAGSTDHATGSSARFNFPLGISLAGANLWVADSSNHSIRKVVVATGAVTTQAGPDGSVGNAAGTSGNVNSATAASARFSNPTSVAADNTNIYVADKGNHLIRVVSIASGAVTTLAGTGASGSTDAVGVLAAFNGPGGVTIDSTGTAAGTAVFVADSVNHTLRRILLSSSAVTTVAGAVGSSGSSDGLGTAAKFVGPLGIAIDGAGSLYVADTNNQLMRKGTLATAPAITSANNATFSVGTAGTFTVVATGSPAVSYSITAGALPGGVTLNATSGVISGTPTTAVGSPFVVTLQASNGVAPAATQTFTLTVNHPPVITSASSTAFVVNTAGSFQVVATGSPAPTFSITAGTLPASVATLNAAGLLTAAPASSTSGSPFSFTITATNSAGTNNQSFTLSVSTGPTITTQPTAQTVGPGTNAQFTVAATSNGGALTYQWQRRVDSTGFFNLSDSASHLGTNTATLTVVSPSQTASGYQYQVVVSSGVGTPATSASVALTVTSPPQITSLNTASFVEAQSSSFTVQATGSPSTMTFSLTSGTLPSGLTLNAGTGAISGTPVAGASATSPYVIQVTASNGVNPGATQSITITVTPTALVPAFTTQPVSLTVALGQTATFTAAVTGNPTPTLQWQRLPVGGGSFVDLANNTTFSGVTTGTLTITSPTSGMSGDAYRVNAVNGSGTTPSSTATLTLVIGTTISTFAGQAGAAGSTDATSTSARFNGQSGIAVDVSGNVYVADTSNHVIRKITSAGVVTTLAGLAGANGSADGTGSAARFNAPSGVAVSSVGTVYVADTYNHIIRVISPEGVVTTLAGLAGSTGSTDATGSSARFLYPYGIALAANGTAYVTDTFNHTIRQVQAGGAVTTFAGTAGARGSANAAGAAARFAFPFAIALDSTGNLYVADSFNHTIRKIDGAGNATTLAGTVGTVGSVDGTGTAALFNQSSGLAVDSAGNVYVADTYNHTIRRVTSLGIVTTLAGVAGTAGSVDGVGAAARFNQPFGIAVDATNNIFISDTRNHTIRRSGNVTAPTITTQPQAAVVVAGANATFTVATTGAPTPSLFTWMRQPAGSTGFTAVTADTTYSGVTGATLTVTGVTSAMSGDQFQVVVSNLISPNATSVAATLTVGTAPVFTSAASASFQVTNAGSFTLAATGTPAPTFSATGLPSWATLNTTTGVLSGTPPDTTGSPIAVTVTATNGIATTQALTLTVLPAVIAPAIANQPSNAAVDQGATAVFSVAATGTAPLTYQWSRNGAPISGATTANLTLSSVQPSVAGSYTVAVSNTAGAISSSVATLVVNTAPVIALQPRTQTALAGSVVSFAVTAGGGTSFNYQWRKNGLQIAGATAASLTLTGVTSADSGNYDVLVSNGLGTAGSSLAQLNVVSTPLAPVITAQPASRAITVGASVTLTVGASGAPSPAYQWRKNGTAIAGATGTTYAVTGVLGDTANYDVVVTNTAGNSTTSAATVRILARSYAGTYFGSFAGSLGTFAMLVRGDNTGVFLGYLPGSSAPVLNLSVTVNDSGGFSFSQAAIASAASVSPNDSEPGRAAALSTVVVSGTIAADGGLTGAIAGGANGSLSATRTFDTGATQGLVGFYQAGASSSAAVSYTIAGPNSQAFVVVQSGSASDGGTGTVTIAGAVNVVTSRSVLAAAISPTTGIVTGSASGAVSASFSGASEAILARQRLVNISSRARVGTGDSVAIAGFVISGEESKPVLIRAVGPTLGVAPFNVAGSLASPRLELFRGATSLGVNTGISANRVAIDAAGAQSGAFALGSSGADAAILTTLAPGGYTAVVSSTTNTAGVALVEVYDLSSAAPGQKLLNIATRASAGAGDNTLIAGFVVPAGSSKRVLVRGVGPGLAPFGVTGLLAQPTLQLLSGGTTVAQNTNWTTSADRDALSAASVQVGAFGMTTSDSALIANLAPGNYTALVTGAGGATGVALIEVYELP